MKRCVPEQHQSIYWLLRVYVCAAADLYCWERKEKKRSFTARHKSPGLFSLRAESQLHAGCLLEERKQMKIAWERGNERRNSSSPSFVSWKVIGC
jgi:hypothetical protein